MVIVIQVGFLFEPIYHTIYVPETDSTDYKKPKTFKTSKYNGKATHITARKNARTSLPIRQRKVQEP